MSAVLSTGFIGSWARSWVFWSVDMSGLCAHAPEVKGSSRYEYAH